MIYSFYFWKHDIDNNYYLKNPEYYRDQGFQEIIYGLNQPYLRVNQSAFTNFTIMDRPYLEELFGGKEFPEPLITKNGDYSTFMIDFIEDLIEYQKAFMREVSRTREKTMFTFPVLTYSLLYKDGKFVDEEFARWCNRHNMKWCDSNFFVSGDVTSLSSCCFDGDQKILTRNSENGVRLCTFKELAEGKYSEYKRNFTVFHNGSWVKARIITPANSKKMYKITTSNKKVVFVTEDHILPTINGDKQVKDITTNDYILFNNRVLSGMPEKDKGYNYSNGFLIGMYLGDGSTYGGTEIQKPRITFSINEEKYEKFKEHLDRTISDFDDKVYVSCYKNGNLLSVTVGSWKIYNFIKEYVFRNYSFEKELNLNCLEQSAEFRRGILDGYHCSDGGNSNRIYSTSKKLIDDIEVLITSLGLNSIVDVTDGTNEPGIFDGKEFSIDNPLYCIRWYSHSNRRELSGVYKVINNCDYFRVCSIEDFESKYDNVYCFDMVNENEPYFTLPNGMITHNCRLVNNFTGLKGFINSIGGTALKIGSIKVSTINLVRIALGSSSKEEYIENLKKIVDNDVKVLDIVRGIIKRNIEKGLLPNYTYGLIDITRQYNTIGINGMYEAVKLFDGIRVDEFGNEYYTEDGLAFASKIMDTINELKDSYSFDYSINVEAVPAERCAVILCAKDKILYPDSGIDRNLYGNQWIPLDTKCTLDEKVRVGAILDNKCGGGQISHINIQGPFASEGQAWDLLNHIAQSGVIYFAYNLKISTCENGHGFIGAVCPTCGKPVVDTYQRVVGFLTPSRSYSKERKVEFSKRYWYDLND